MIKGYIYKITCKVNNKVYIGQTIQSLKNRLNSHFHDATSKGYTYAFANAIRKYGEENFYIEEISYHESNSKKELKKILDLEEQKNIKLYDSYINGYNSTLGGDGTLGFKLSEYHKLKISNSLKGHKRTEEEKLKISMRNKGRKLSESTKNKLRQARLEQVFTNEHIEKHKESMKKIRKRVAKYSINGELIQVFESLTLASEQSNLSMASIGMVCNNQRSSGGGFYWRFVDEDIPSKLNINTKLITKNINKNKNKIICQYTKEGQKIREFESISSASKYTTIHTSSITSNCKGKRKTAGGYIWRYKEE